MDGGSKQQPSTEAAAGWYKPGAGAAVITPESHEPVGPEEVVEWTASEFIAHEKTFMWYLVYGLFAVVVVGGIYLITRDVISTIVAVILFVFFAISAAHKPKVVSYRLDRSGITAGSRFHPYSEYRSFAVIDEGPFSSISLMPIKRLAMPFSLYLAPEQEQEIYAALGRRLPVEPAEMGLVETLMRRLRF